MKNLRRFFDHTRAHETAEGLVKPLLISLTLSMVMIALVAPLALSVACMALLALSLSLHALKFSLPWYVSYALGFLTLLGLRSSLPNGVNSPEFIACFFAVISLAQSMRLKSYWHCQLLLIWLLASNATTSLLDDSATLSVWIILVMFLNLTQFLRLHVKDFSVATLTSSLRAAIRTTVYTLPMLLVFIYVFHRSNENRHQFSDATVSGVSASLEPGRVSKLSMRSGVAYRVSLSQPLPPLIEQYWKVATLARSKGMKWTRQPHENEYISMPAQPHNACLIEQTVFSQQSSEATQFLALDRPIEGSFRRTLPVRVSSYVCGFAGEEELNAVDRERHLLVEGEVSPRAKQLAMRLTAKATRPIAKANAILNYFKQHDFKYTLQPAALPEEQALDHFLFDTKEGFCEHYAAALATLLRLAGVPTRVVVGFEGGEYNPFGHYWLISYQDAHAWVEVWNDSRWERVDPVAVLAPQALGAGRPSQSFLTRLGHLPAVESAWLAVDSLIFATQQAFSGHDKVLSLGDLTLDPLLALGSLLALFVVLQLKKFWQPAEVALQERFRELCSTLETAGLRRARSEGFESYRQRVSAWMKASDQPPALVRSVDQIFTDYLSHRFGRTTYGARDLTRLIVSIRAARKELRRRRRFKISKVFKRAS